MAVYRGGEFYHELFAQYICNGEVKLKRDGFETIDLVIGDSFPVKQYLGLQEVDKTTKHVEKYLNILFSEALTETKGKYYVL
jgi:uncharacterized cupin superfamily protein